MLTPVSWAIFSGSYRQDIILESVKNTRLLWVFSCWTFFLAFWFDVLNGWDAFSTVLYVGLNYGSGVGLCCSFVSNQIARFQRAWLISEVCQVVWMSTEGTSMAYCSRHKHPPLSVQLSAQGHTVIRGVKTACPSLQSRTSNPIAVGLWARRSCIKLGHSDALVHGLISETVFIPRHTLFDYNTRCY